MSIFLFTLLTKDFFAPLIFNLYPTPVMSTKRYDFKILGCQEPAAPFLTKPLSCLRVACLLGRPRKTLHKLSASKQFLPSHMHSEHNQSTHSWGWTANYVRTAKRKSGHEMGRYKLATPMKLFSACCYYLISCPPCMIDE